MTTETTQPDLINLLRDWAQRIADDTIEGIRADNPAAFLEATPDEVEMARSSAFAGASLAASALAQAEVIDTDKLVEYLKGQS